MHPNPNPHLSLTLDPRLRSRPSDPLAIELPGTYLSLVFSRYTRPVPPTDTLSLLLQFALTINQRVIAAHGDTPIGIDFEFHFGHAFMIVYAKEEPLTYGQLSAVVRGMAAFAQEYGWAGYDMVIKNDADGEKVIGRALFRYI